MSQLDIGWFSDMISLLFSLVISLVIYRDVTVIGSVSSYPDFYDISYITVYCYYYSDIATIAVIAIIVSLFNNPLRFAASSVYEHSACICLGAAWWQCE